MSTRPRSDAILALHDETEDNHIYAPTHFYPGCGIHRRSSPSNRGRHHRCPQAQSVRTFASVFIGGRAWLDFRQSLALVHRHVVGRVACDLVLRIITTAAVSVSLHTLSCAHPCVGSPRRAIGPPPPVSSASRRSARIRAADTGVSGERCAANPLCSRTAGRCYTPGRELHSDIFPHTKSTNSRQLPAQNNLTMKHSTHRSVATKTSLRRPSRDLL